MYVSVCQLSLYRYVYLNSRRQQYNGLSFYLYFCNFSEQFWNTIEFQFHFYSHRLFFVVIQDVKAENHCPVLHRTHCLLILHDITLNIKIFYIQSLKSYLGIYTFILFMKSIQDLRKLKYIYFSWKDCNVISLRIGSL